MTNPTTIEERLKKAMRPRVVWKGKAKAFRLFDKGLRPPDISPRQVCFVKRRTLYVYFEEWKKHQRIFPALLAHYTQEEAQAKLARLGELGTPIVRAVPSFGLPAELDDDDSEE